MPHAGVAALLAAAIFATPLTAAPQSRTKDSIDQQLGEAF